MIREFRFRSWELYDFDDPRVMQYSRDYDNLCVFFSMCNADILMQWTGLVDKTGKDIYEGDLYRTVDKTVYQVFFHNGAFAGGVSVDNCGALGWQGDEGPPHDVSPTDGSSEYMEIIGNIYENPDLLQQTEETK